MIHQGDVNLECITLVAEICYILIKVQISIKSRQDVSYLDMVLDLIGQQGPPHTSHELEVQNYVLHSIYPLFINFGHLNVVCFHQLHLPLMLVMQQRCAVDVPDHKVLEVMFHHFEHEHHMFEIFAAWMDI